MQTEIEQYIRNEYIPYVYADKKPSSSEKNDEHWFVNFIKDAVDGNWYNFYLHWLDNKSDRNINNILDVTIICNMVNEIRKWSDDNYIPEPNDGLITPELVLNNFAYVYVMKIGINGWRKILHEFDTDIKYEENESNTEYNYTGFARPLYRAHQDNNVSDLCEEIESELNDYNSDCDCFSDEFTFFGERMQYFRNITPRGIDETHNMYEDRIMTLARKHLEDEINKADEFDFRAHQDNNVSDLCEEIESELNDYNSDCDCFSDEFTFFGERMQYFRNITPRGIDETHNMYEDRIMTLARKHLEDEINKADEFDFRTHVFETYEEKLNRLRYVHSKEEYETDEMWEARIAKMARNTMEEEDIEEPQSALSIRYCDDERPTRHTWNEEETQKDKIQLYVKEPAFILKVERNK